MSIKNRSAMIIFEFIIGFLSAFAAWLQFLTFGVSAWRLFATWLALVAAIYYILNAFITLIAKRRPLGTEFFPMLQGGLIISGITMALIHIISYATDAYVPSAGGNAFLVGFLLPVLMIMSWVMFSTKGVWRAYDPFYWLSLPAIYFSAILVSGEFLPRTARFAYPYDFLNYPSIGIDVMLWWLAIFAAVILPIGYVLWILDFAFSGKLAQHVVLPKIKVMIVEEEVEDEPSKSSKKPPEIIVSNVIVKQSEPSKPKSSAKKSAEKPVKLVASGQRNGSHANESSESENLDKKDEPSTPPPVRIIEKISVDNRATPPKPADNRSQEIVIDGDQKSVAPKAEPQFEMPKVEIPNPVAPKIDLPEPPAPSAPTHLPMPPEM